MHGTTIIGNERKTNLELPIVLSAGIGLFLSTLDTGIMNVALPTLSSIFHVSFSVVSWTVVMYLLTLTATIIVFGRLSDRFGRIRIYSWGLGVFMTTSILCGCAVSAVQLIFFRALQGIGAAMLQATAAAIITTHIPQERRGAALGSLGTIIGLGPVIGPSLGGFLLSFASWRWIFLINIPICMAGLYGCYKLRALKPATTKLLPLDLAGNFLLTTAVSALLYGISRYSDNSLAAAMKVAPFSIFIMVFIVYLYWENRVSHPILPLSLFKKLDFSVSLFSVTALGLSTSISFIVPPYFLEQVSLLAPWQVGVINLASPLGLVILSKFSGKLIATWGTTRLMSFGLFLMLVALLCLRAVETNCPAAVSGILLFLYGIGAGFFVPPNLSSIMGAAGKELQGTIGAVQRMIQNIGIAIGASTTASIIQSHTHMSGSGLVLATRESWMIAAFAILISLVSMLSIRLFDKHNIE